MQLWNTLNKEELVKQLNESRFQFVTVSFYQYALIENPSLFRDHLFLHWSELNIVGRVYVALEGINAQLSVPTLYFDRFRTELNQISFLENIR